MDPDRAFQFAQSSLHSCRLYLWRGGGTYFHSDFQAALHWAMDGWLGSRDLPIDNRIAPSINQAIYLTFHKHAEPELAVEVGYLLNRSVIMEYDDMGSGRGNLEEMLDRAEKVVAEMTKNYMEARGG